MLNKKKFLNNIIHTHHGSESNESQSRSRLWQKEDKIEKTYARLQLAQLVSLEELAENINDKMHIPVATAKTVLEYLPEAIAQLVRLGHGVYLGFGILKPSISTSAYDDPSKVEVRKKRFTFRIKSKLRSILDQLSVSITGGGEIDVEDDDTTPAPGGGSNDNQGGGSQGGDDILNP